MTLFLVQMPKTNFGFPQFHHIVSIIHMRNASHVPKFKKGIYTGCRPVTVYLLQPAPRPGSVVEEPDVLFYEGDAQLLSRLKDRLVVLAAAWSSNVLGSGLGNPVDIVGEGEL